MLFDLHKLCWTPAAAVASISWSVLICEDSKQGTIALDTTRNTAGEKKMISTPISRIAPGWGQQQAQFSEILWAKVFAHATDTS